MKRLLLTTLMAMTAVALNAGTPRLRTVEDVMASVQPRLNSHVGAEKWSSLQPIPGSLVVLPHDWCMKGTPGKTAIYPRIKKMANGEYIMFFHSERLGSRVFATRSADLRNWSAPEVVFAPYKVQSHGVSDIRRFVNPDAVVLPNGDILLVVSYREEKTYKKYGAGGLMLSRSSDNGLTWSRPETIYRQSNWEPYLLLLPDGTLQCYFTDSPTPESRNSGTGMITSKDGGKSWSGKMRVSAQYKRNYDGNVDEYIGTPTFTDQMPCFRVLGDGKTIMGAVEARLEEPNSESGTSYFRISLVYNDGFEWKDLGQTLSGPERRHDNVIVGAAGYLSVFPSGEVVLSYNSKGLLRLKLLDSKGQLAPGQTWDSSLVEPFSGNGGYWGCTEVVSPKSLVCAMHCGKGGGEEPDPDKGIQIMQCYLNQRIDAPKAQVKLDGDTEEFAACDALYYGAENGCETLYSALYDEQNLYISVESKAGSKDVSATQFALVGKNGKNTLIKIAKNGKLNADKAIVSASAKAVASSGAAGLTTEVAIPLSLLDLKSGDELSLITRELGEKRIILR